MSKHEKYVLLTPARNEEAYIGNTIKSVIMQTVLPVKWVIISDGSTDSTDEIVKKYQKDNGFIELLRVDSGVKRDFNSKVNAFNAGYEKLSGYEYDFIGNLDADITFEPDYFQRILEKFTNEKLGIAGGWIHESDKGMYQPRPANRTRNVPGAVQLYRRECFEGIGGLEPFEKGGEDAIAEIKAKMKGWEVQSYPGIKVLHHRHTGLGQGNRIKASFNNGMLEYSYRYLLIFEMIKFLYRIPEKPFFLSSFSRLCGFLWALITRVEQSLPDDIVRYIREDQKKRLIPVR